MNSSIDSRIFFTIKHKRKSIIALLMGGFFEKVRKLQTTLTQIFIALESESHGLSDFVQFILKIETDFSAKIGISNSFSAQKQMISKKKKVFTEIKTQFSTKIGISNAFSGRITTSTSQLRVVSQAGLFGSGSGSGRVRA